MLGPALWALLAVGLLAWLTLPDHRPFSRGHPFARALLEGAMLGLGQLVTHGALSIAPLVAGQRRHMGHASASHAHGHEHLTSGPDARALLDALTHGGVPMLLAHSLGTVAAVLAWALAREVWAAVGDWLRRITVRLAAVTMALHAPAALPRLVPPVLAPHHDWEGRGPPCGVAVTGSAPPSPPALRPLHS